MEFYADEVFMTLLLPFQNDSVRLSAKLIIYLNILRLKSHFLVLSGGFLREAQVKDG